MANVSRKRVSNWSSYMNSFPRMGADRMNRSFMTFERIQFDTSGDFPHLKFERLSMYTANAE